MYLPFYCVNNVFIHCLAEPNDFYNVFILNKCATYAFYVIFTKMRFIANSHEISGTKIRFYFHGSLAYDHYSRSGVSYRHRNHILVTSYFTNCRGVKLGQFYPKLPLVYIISLLFIPIT